MNCIATLALAAIFTSMMAHGQDVPDRLCGYIEFPFRYSEAQGHYYRVTPQLAKRGRPYGSLDVTQAQSIVQASSADLNGNSQVVVSYREIALAGQTLASHAGSQFTLTPMPCGSEAPPNDGYVCAATAGLVPIRGPAYDRHGMRFDDHEQIEHFWELEDIFDDAHPDTIRATRECLDYARADYPGHRQPYLTYGPQDGLYFCEVTVWAKGERDGDTFVEPRRSSGLHNLGHHLFQGTLQGVRFGFGGGAYYFGTWLTFYETRDNCPALPTNGD